MKTFVEVPQSITYKDILNKNYTLSPSLYKEIEIKNDNKKQLKDLLEEEIDNSYKGVEVGSFAYISKSPYYFIRTKALQPYYFTLNEDKESIIPILPQKFKFYDLREGDILISKDSNIGEVVILDRDLPNYMISGGIYKLPVMEDIKYYVFAFLKSEFFKEQLHLLVSRGATIKHAKTLFLECFIPFPNQENSDEVIKYVELLVKAIINKEREIKRKHYLILEKIEEELVSNQRNNYFKYDFPKYSELFNKKRLDTGLYTKEFKEIDFLIKNYKRSFFTIDGKKIYGGNTPKKRLFGLEGQYKYQWVTPSQISDYGTILNIETINTPVENNINKNAMLIVNRTSKGGIGEYVGISMFYDVSILGKGYHNQGIYRVEGYSDYILHFMVAFLNSKIMRKYCASLSVGSKMKEIKINQISQIPFPNFPENKMKEIARLYYNYVEYPSDLNTDNFLYKDNEWNKKAGILQLDLSIKQLRKKLDEIIFIISNGKNVSIEFTLKRK